MEIICHHIQTLFTKQETRVLDEYLWVRLTEIIASTKRKTPLIETVLDSLRNTLEKVTSRYKINFDYI